MKRTLSLVVLNALIMIILFPVPSDASLKNRMKSIDERPQVERIIMTTLTAYGGKVAIKMLRSVYAEGTIEAFLKKDRGTYRRYLDRGRMLRVDIKYYRGAETRVLNGSRGYRSSSGGLISEVKGARLRSMIYQYNNLDLPGGLASGAYEVALKGQDIIGGREAHVLTLTGSGPKMDVYIDARTGYIIKTTGYFKLEGQAVTLSSEFKDFRPTGITVLPYEIINYASGMKIARTDISRYDINPAFDGSLFSLEKPYVYE